MYPGHTRGGGFHMPRMYLLLVLPPAVWMAFAWSAHAALRKVLGLTIVTAIALLGTRPVAAAAQS